MERAEAINWLKAISFVSDHHITEAIDMAIEALQTEVVRCKDCKLYGTTDCQIQESFYGIKDFDFCSYGERKGGDDE